MAPKSSGQPQENLEGQVKVAYHGTVNGNGVFSLRKD